MFLREAAHAHKAGLTQEQLNAHLVEMRRVLNAALQVRTVEQKNHRIEVVRDHLTKMLHRDSRSRNPWGI